MTAIRNILLALVILSLLAFPLPAIADGESPTGEILNPDGSIRWDLLSDLGTVSESADWMDITLPGGIVLDLDATCQCYQTPSRNILVLPSPATLFFKAMHPVESGLANAESMLGNGAAMLAMLVGPSLNSEQLAQLATMGYTDPRENARGANSALVRNPLIEASPTAQQYTLHQNEILFWGMSDLREVFLFLVLTSPIGLSYFTAMLIGLAEETSTWAAGRNLTDAEWQQHYPGEAYRETCPPSPLHRQLT